MYGYAAGDDPPPAFRAGYPAAVDVDAGAFALLLGLDEASTAHYWLLEDDAAHPTTSPPTAAEVAGGAPPPAAVGLCRLNQVDP